jgi:uncharacterized protein (DUF1800 family)
VVRIRRPIDSRINNLQPPPRRGINENYARELMELRLVSMAATQKDVQEVARCLLVGPSLRLAVAL